MALHKNLNRITLHNLASEIGDSSRFQGCDELLNAVADTIVELIYIYRTNAECATMAVCEDHPDLEKRYGWEYIEALAEFVLAAELPGISARLQELFDEWNAVYFWNRLPKYSIRVVFDIHTFAQEPVPDIGACSGLIRVAEQYIYIRYEEEELMRGMLVHEMAHAATDGNHDEPWNTEMRRLSQAGAPVLKSDFD
jgi:hypothetical protein